MTSSSRQSLDDSVRQHQKFQRQIMDIQSLVIELHHALSAARLAGCSIYRGLRGPPPAARAGLARATNPGLPAPILPTVTYGPSGTGTAVHPSHLSCPPRKLGFWRGFREE